MFQTDILKVFSLSNIHIMGKLNIKYIGHSTQPKKNNIAVITSNNYTDITGKKHQSYTL